MNELLEMVGEFQVWWGDGMVRTRILGEGDGRWFNEKKREIKLVGREKDGGEKKRKSRRKREKGKMEREKEQRRKKKRARQRERRSAAIFGLGAGDF